MTHLPGTALLATAMGQGSLPGNLPGLTCPPGVTLPATAIPMPKASTILKIASGMGGHNAAVGLRG